jgi:hypothetical protein
LHKETALANPPEVQVSQIGAGVGNVGEKLSVLQNRFEHSI